ncbi:AI-2E family transporter [Microbacterium sp. M28]|uniref:AI-2E family transporter n=1 Tax=Microbacterium sp. M28 TaxID=2962064 RepID=UPI0021F4E854|nr:AI-2E family transporter [Microbacterium sp. M28]UYO95716.1 AI-2E family transporter [Microbacterium sp. M28]
MSDSDPVPSVVDAPAPASRRAGLLRLVPAHPLVSGFTVALGVILAIALSATVASLSTVLISVFLGMFLALGLDPAVQALERRGLRRALGIAIVAVAFLALMLVILFVVIPATVRQFITALEAAPEAIAAMQGAEWYLALEQNLGVDLGAVIAEGVKSVANISSFLAISGGVLRAGFGIVGAISSFVMVVVLTLYFVSSLSAMKQTVANLVPAYQRKRFSELLEQITGSVGAVVAGGVTLSTFNALVVLVIQLLIGSSVPAVMAIAAFFITLVPLIGSLIFLLIGTVGALFISPGAAVVFLVLYFIYIQLEAYFVTPRVMGRAVAVPAVLVIIGAMVGATLMGLLGALVAIPITASILIIIRQVVIPRQNAITRAPDA